LAKEIKKVYSPCELEIYLANPRGFCAGVSRAVEIVNKVLKKYEPPIYVRHEIVHNKSVVSQFKERGVIFVEDINEIPSQSAVIFSAHGASRDIYKKAEKKKLHVIDATCPLVKKVHLSAKKHSKNRTKIILIGHKNHPEVTGTLGQLKPGEIVLIEDTSSARSHNFETEEKLAYITQTTFSQEDVKEIIEILKNRIPNIKGPPEGDLCYATTNRQNAVKELCKNVELLFIVGSQNSSNCNRLKSIGTKCGIPSYLIDQEKDIDMQWLKDVNKIGISSGASTPEQNVKQIVEWFKNNFKVKNQINVTYTTESLHFKLPKDL
jgi:4-hydroxy-3-methylbut-2-enyl diphosphate reductase